MSQFKLLNRFVKTKMKRISTLFVYTSKLRFGLSPLSLSSYFIALVFTSYYFFFLKQRDDISIEEVKKKKKKIRTTFQEEVNQEATICRHL